MVHKRAFLIIAKRLQNNKICIDYKIFKNIKIYYCNRLEHYVIIITVFDAVKFCGNI